MSSLVRMGSVVNIRSGGTPSCDHLYRIGSNSSEPWNRGLQHQGMRMERAMTGWRWPAEFPVMLHPLLLNGSDGSGDGAI